MNHRRLRTTAGTLLLASGLVLLGDFEARGDASAASAMAQWLAQDKTIAKRIQSGFAQRDKAAREDVQWMEITSKQVLERLLADNLELKRGALEPARAAVSSTLAETAFDPVVSANLGRTFSQKYKRTVRDLKWSKATGACLDPVACAPEVTAGADVNALVYVINPADSVVAYQKFDRQRVAGYYDHSIPAVKEDAKGSSLPTNFAVSGSKAFRPGPKVSANYSVVYKNAEYVLNADSTNPGVGSYNRRWSSSVGTSVATPLPETKDAGRHGSQNAAVDQAQLRQQSSEEGFQDLRNRKLHEGRRAFWELVRAVKALDFAQESRQDHQALMARSKRLFDASSVTNYAMAQTEAALEQSKVRELAAVESYLAASNALALLLKLDHGVRLLPVEYQKELLALQTFSLEEALSEGEKQNPRLKVGAKQVEMAGVEKNRSLNAAKPDLSLTASITAAQSNALYGYTNYLQSVSRLGEPDRVSASVGVRYRRPVGNHGPEATVAMAEEEVVRQELALQENRSRLLGEIRGAYSVLASARERRAIAERNLSLQTTAAGKLQDMQADRRVTEYEIIVRNLDLLQARQHVVNALVDGKISESALILALGRMEQDSMRSAAPAEKVVADAGSEGGKP
ncbi:MAG: TolC family protein [Magnetococcales bacterium]|nr:TolC family protein [Magnetococcales bacterium]